ncbi:HotDog domain-containing protein [Bisporella sp. PMI_857]|nr:HotDog domain-containing protein [Bisporella sp. PMI_857]
MDADEAYFRSIPWCAKLLSDPAITITPTGSRQYKKTTEDAFFAKTLQTKDTISACLSFHKRPASPTERIDEIHTLLSLEYGVNGYPHVAHGGFVAVLIDEIMGVLLSINRKRMASSGLDDLVTANLNVDFLKQVSTPQDVLVSVSIKETSGRKQFISATVKDQDEVVLAKAKALWVAVHIPREKL